VIAKPPTHLHVITLYAAVLILLLTVGLGWHVDSRHNAIHQQQRETLLGLERMQRHSQLLTHLLSTAALERNALRIIGYDNTLHELDSALEQVAQQSRALRLAGDVTDLQAENAQLRAWERQAIDQMRAGNWSAATDLLFGDDYLRARRIYEINSSTTAMAVTGEVEAMASTIDLWRRVFIGLRMASIAMLLWAGLMFSRQLRLELATRNRLQTEISAANAALEQRVEQRTAELQAANQKLEQLSMTDSLTGLQNRRRFDQAFESEWQRSLRQAEPLAILMVDVDEFKAYNDHYGHQGGDECLRQIAAVMQTCSRRAGELNARYGGEEFVVLLPGVGAEQAAAHAQRLRSEVELLSMAHIAGKARQVVTVSIGLASWVPERGQNPYSMLKAADEALYQAKREGRNRVVLSSPPPSSG